MNKKILAGFLTLIFVISTTVVTLIVVSANSPTATGTVAVTEHNVGTDDYYISADVTFSSENEFTAGLFTVEAENLTLNGCTVSDCTGGEEPEIRADYNNNKVLFFGFSDSSVNDIRSYTSLSLTLTFAVNPDVQVTSYKVTVKDINIANVDEVKFVTDDAEGTLNIGHSHTTGETWEKDATNHWKVCTECSAQVYKAAHTEGEWIIDTPATTEAAGHRHKECTVCGYHMVEDDIEKLSGGHTPGDINGDGSVNNKDLTRLFQYLSNWDVSVNDAALDVNGDGSVNNKDLTRLFQYLSNWDVVIF